MHYQVDLSTPHGVPSSIFQTHPFIMTSLDSKGLEFDDCVIAFDAERKAWDVGSSEVCSLRLLRELYVAITRAKRRVVILINSRKMREFFVSLDDCNIEESDAKVALLEFDSKTTREEWLNRGEELFEVRALNIVSFSRSRHFPLGHFRTNSSNWPRAVLRPPVNLCHVVFDEFADRLRSHIAQWRSVLFFRELWPHGVGARQIRYGGGADIERESVFR